MDIVLIAAMDRNRAIGFENQLPWHLPDDLKFFKAQTQGGVVIMGRKTFESLGCRPLPNRRNIILTRQADCSYDGVEIAQDWSGLRASLLSQQLNKVWVIGGGEIYRLALPDANYLVITQVDTELALADTWFPEWQSSDWQLTQSDHHDKDDRHAFEFLSQVWKRIASFV